MTEELKTTWMGGKLSDKQPHSIKHLVLIMDGNRRWAKEQGLQAWAGHESGIKPVKTAINFCLDRGIPNLSLYAFSLENFKRSAEELGHLFTVIESVLGDGKLEELVSRSVRIKFVGDRSQFPEKLRKLIERWEQKTATGDKLILNILFCYGGQQEIVAAVKEIARELKRGGLEPEDISGKTIEDHVWMAGIPAPDLVVRTGGAQRLSNVMQWQSAYSELLFLDTHWPAITYEDLEKVVDIYLQRRRNFGK